MAIHTWGKISSKVRRKLSKAMRGRAAYWITKAYKREIGTLATQMNIPAERLYWITKAYKREIGTLATQMNIPAERLREHFNFLAKQGVRPMNIGNRMIQDLREMAKLRQSTSVEPARWNNFMKNRPLNQAMEEMKEHAQAEAQTQQQ